MVCDLMMVLNLQEITIVLILLFLEYGLRQECFADKKVKKAVLILLFLEYGLRLVQKLIKASKRIVLILLFLEYGLRQEELKLN